MDNSIVLVFVDGGWVKYLVEVGRLAVNAIDGVGISLAFRRRHALKADSSLDGVLVALPCTPTIALDFGGGSKCGCSNSLLCEQGYSSSE